MTDPAGNSATDTATFFPKSHLTSHSSRSHKDLNKRKRRQELLATCRQKKRWGKNEKSDKRMHIPSFFFGEWVGLVVDHHHHPPPSPTQKKEGVGSRNYIIETNQKCSETLRQHRLCVFTSWSFVGRCKFELIGNGSVFVYDTRGQQCPSRTKKMRLSK